MSVVDADTSACYNMVVKAIKLILSDQVHQIALDLAKAEDVEIGQFSAGVLSDAIIVLSRKYKDNAKEPPLATTASPQDLPDTAVQLHEVCRCVWLENKDLSEAISAAAYRFKVLESTVRDKCTRRINLPSISDFTKLLSQPQDLVDHLCRKFVRHAAGIRALFASILPGNGRAPSSLPQNSPPPPTVPEMDLIAAIIDVLRAHGGKLDKADTEREVFAQFETTFNHPHYQDEVGGGVERWRKNVQFARNTACNTLELIKTPYEAGRGVWELTDKGRTWVRS